MYHFYELISHQFRLVRGNKGYLIKTFVSNLGGLNFIVICFLSTQRMAKSNQTNKR